MHVTLVIEFCFISIALFAQCSTQSDPSSANQQIQLLLEEKQQVEVHTHQVRSANFFFPFYCVDTFLIPFIEISAFPSQQV